MPWGSLFAENTKNCALSWLGVPSASCWEWLSNIVSLKARLPCVILIQAFRGWEEYVQGCILLIARGKLKNHCGILTFRRSELFCPQGLAPSWWGGQRTMSSWIAPRPMASNGMLATSWLTLLMLGPQCLACVGTSKYLFVELYKSIRKEWDSQGDGQNRRTLMAVLYRMTSIHLLIQ